MKNITLGILGGLGPMSGAHFYKEIIAHTQAESDSEHIDVILSGQATTPDRTAYILGESENSPLPDMAKNARMLEKCGADIIAVPCNTAQYFYEKLASCVNIPILNIIDETTAFAKKLAYKKIGIFATRGTVISDSYKISAEKHGIECVYPATEDQNFISSAIYGSVKAAKPVDMEKFLEIADKMYTFGCDCIILGCTELSLIELPDERKKDFLDSLQVLTYRAIQKCGKIPKGFDIRFGG